MKKKHNGRGYIGYKSYVFRTKDPVIDQLRTIWQDADTSLGKVSDNSGVSVSTMRNWFYGETRRPQNATVEAFGRAVGKKRVWVENK